MPPPPRLRALGIGVSLLACPLLATGAWAVGTFSSIPDRSFGDKGLYTSIALDAAGNPVVSYYDATNGRLKVLHCAEGSCPPENASISAISLPGDAGLYTSLTLDASGNPVVAYYDATAGDLKLLHCNDPDCATGGNVATPDAAGDVGGHASLELDGGGHPVVSYYDASNGDLRVLHCDDTNCTGGGESGTAPDTAGDVGQYTSLELDATGNPVVSYYDATNDKLKVMHCNDANCAGNNETVTTPDAALILSGIGTSLALDASGRPVIAYFEDTNGALRVMHCNDANCAGNNESIAVVDSTARVGLFPTLVLDAAGRPVVSHYRSSGSDLRFVHCNDPNCGGGDENPITLHEIGGAGLYPSIALGPTGNPVVSYYDQSNRALRLLSCTDPACADVKEVGGVTELTRPLREDRALALWPLALGVAAIVAAGALAIGASRRAR